MPLCLDNKLIEDTDRDINIFAKKGLRTLAVAYREIPQEEYDEIAKSNYIELTKFSITLPQSYMFRW